MKKFFTFCITYCFAIAGIAQNFSAGINTGGTFWIPNKDAANEGWYKNSKKLITWDRGAFLRYETKGRVALEAAYNNFKINARQWDWVGGGQLDYGTTDSSIHYPTYSSSTFNEIKLGVQYRILPKSSKLKTYVGVQLTYGINHYVDEERIVFPNNTDRTIRLDKTNYYSMVGATCRLSYPIFNHVDLHWQGTGSWMIGNLETRPLVNNNVWFRISSIVGVSYHL